MSPPRLWVRAVIAIASGVAGVIAGFLAVALSLEDPVLTNPPVSADSADFEFVEALERQVATLGDVVAALDERITNLESSGVSKNTATAAELSSIRSAIDRVADHQEELDNAIQATPEKALALPLLAEEVENLSEDLSTTRADLARADDRQMELFKWILGVVAVGLIGNAIALWRQTPPTKPSPEG